MSRALENRLARLEEPGAHPDDPWVRLFTWFFPGEPLPPTEADGFLRMWQHVSDSLDEKPHEPHA